MLAFLRPQAHAGETRASGSIRTSRACPHGTSCLFTPASPRLISTFVSRASALLLAFGGLVLLFAGDAVLPRLVPGFPPTGAWLGQLVAAAWLGVAALNWTSQGAMLGGIYGRPVVLANGALYFIAATSLARALARDRAPAALWALLVPAATFAVVYAWLLLRGPLASDFARQRGPST